MKTKSIALLFLQLAFCIIAKPQTFTSIDICSGICSSLPTHYTLYNNQLYFQASDSIHGIELWVTNGTVAGTHMVKDIAPGVAGSFAQSFTILNNRIVFSARDTTNGNELWITDGTEAGTIMLKNINPGNNNSSPFGLSAYNNSVLFFADDGVHGTEPWITDGTEAGTSMLLDIYTGTTSSNPNGYINYNDKVFFGAGANGNVGLWCTDGTTANTKFIKQTNANPFIAKLEHAVVFNNKLYFATANASAGNELWVSDGTAAGTVLLKDIYAGSFSSHPSFFTIGSNYLYFTAGNGTNGNELWIMDSTGNAHILKDIYPGTKSSGIFELEFYNGALFFMASDSIHGAELWKSDGSEAGTQMVKDIALGSDGSYPRFFSEYHNKLYFTTGSTISQLGVTNGSEGGTEILLAPQATGAFYSLSNTDRFISFNDMLVFRAKYNNTGFELWFFNDAPNAIEDITAAEPYAVFPNPFTKTIGITGLQVGLSYTTRLFDLAGRELQTQQLTALGTEVQFLPPPVVAGIYLLQVQQGQSIFTLKVIKE